MLKLLAVAFAMIVAMVACGVATTTRHRRRPRRSPSRSSASTTITATAVAGHLRRRHIGAGRQPPGRGRRRIRRRPCREAEGAKRQQRGRRRRRLHRRHAADLFAVPRRAVDRNPEPHRPGVQRGRQSRVRSRFGRAAAPAKRRLQDHQRHHRSEQLQGATVGTPVPFEGAKFKWLSANVDRRPATGKTLLPAFGIEDFNGVSVAFIGMTLKATPTIVTPTGVAGLEFATRQRPSTRWCRRCARRASRRSSCWCTKAVSRPALGRHQRLRRRPRGLGDRGHRRQARQRGRPGRQRPHARRLQLHAAQRERPQDPGDERERVRAGAERHRRDDRSGHARHHRGDGDQPPRRSQRHDA